MPTASAITYGQTLDSSTLSGGTVTGVGNDGVLAGNWSWADSTTAHAVSDSGTTEYEVTFEPDDTTHYESVTTTIKLTVYPKAVTITAQDKAFTYSGEAQSWNQYDVDGLVGSDAISAVVTGSITFPSQSPVTNALTSYEFTTGAAGNYSVTTVNGQLTMTNASAAITITAASERWTYDGNAHSSNAVTVTSGSLLTGDSLVAAASGSVTNVADTATGNNTVVAGYKVMHGAEDVTANYVITTQAGTLTITPKTVTVTAQNKAFTYSGETQSWNQYDVNGLAGSDAISAVVTGNITFPGQSPVTNTLTSYEFTTGTPGNYSVTTANGQLTMTNASVAITITAASERWTYDGSAHSNNAVTITSGSLLTGDSLVATASGSVTHVADTVAGNNPVAAGYKIMHGAEDVTASYTITTQAGTLTIHPKSVTIADITATSRDYNGEMTVALSGGTVSGKIGDDNVTVDLSAATGTMADANVGENKAVTVTGARLGGADAANYTPSAQPTGVTVTINRAANPATVTNSASVMRGGNTVDLSANVALNGATGAVSYAISGEAKGCSMSGSVLTSGANTGSVTVNVTIAAHGNYLALTATPITVTVTDKAIQTITAADVTAAYGDTDKKVTATTNGNGAISYAVKSDSGDYIGVNAATGALTIRKVPANGKACVTVTAAETIGYEHATRDVTVTINNAVPTVTAPAVKTLTYTGSAQALVNAGTTTGSTIQYSLDGKTYSTTIPTGTDAKAYTVYYKVVGDANYNGVDARTVTATIGKGSATVTAPTAKSLTYTGSAQALVNAGTTTGGTMQYSLDGKTYSTTIPTGTDAKTYTVYYKVTGDANHSDAAAQKVTATIGKAAIQSKVSISGWVLGAKANAPEVTGNTGKGEVTFTYAERDSAEFSAKVPTKAGKYTVKASIAETANYKSGEATADFTIRSTISTSELPEADFVTPKAVKTISAQAFAGIAAVHVRVGDKVETLGSKAFANCPNLKSIYIPESVKTIKDNLLDGCGKVTVYGNSATVKSFANNNGLTYIQVK